MPRDVTKHQKKQVPRPRPAMEMSLNAVQSQKPGRVGVDISYRDGQVEQQEVEIRREA